jgi:hypothetical protein
LSPISDFPICDFRLADLLDRFAQQIDRCLSHGLFPVGEPLTFAVAEALVRLFRREWPAAIVAARFGARCHSDGRFGRLVDLKRLHGLSLRAQSKFTAPNDSARQIPPPLFLSASDVIIFAAMSVIGLLADVPLDEGAEFVRIDAQAAADAHRLDLSLFAEPVKTLLGDLEKLDGLIDRKEPFKIFFCCLRHKLC